MKNHQERTSLKAFVVILLVLTLIQCNSSKNSPSSNEFSPFVPSEMDSTNAMAFREKMVDEYFGEEEEVGMSGIDEGVTIHGLSRLPLRIYSTSGEFCGAYCNPFYSNLIQWDDDWKSEQSLGVIDSVFSIDSHHVAIISSGWGRPAGYYTITFSSLLVLEHGLDSIPHIVPVNPNAEYPEDYLFAVSSPHYLSPDPNIEFSGDTVKYQYAMDLLNWEERDTCYSVKGAYLFSEDGFSEIFEEKTIISREDF
ncbi:MAG: hypothetical protein SchgKO_15800 [Schleiferiaceae bacterium]